jgi:gluconokinase
MPNVPGLRSPYEKVGRIVYFGRMLDKIRLHAAGKLPPEYHANLGDAQPGVFDARCCRFLGVAFAEIQKRTLEGLGNAEVLGWVESRGAARTDEDCKVWNSFLMKRGWHDPEANVEALRKRLRESGLEGRGIETFFDYIDADEGRDAVSSRAWEGAHKD